MKDRPIQIGYRTEVGRLYGLAVWPIEAVSRSLSTIQAMAYLMDACWFMAKGDRGSALAFIRLSLRILEMDEQEGSEV